MPLHVLLLEQTYLQQLMGRQEWLQYGEQKHLVDDLALGNRYDHLQ
jgi:hypothetical protein